MSSLPCTVDSKNISTAWISALEALTRRGVSELTPLIVHIRGFQDGQPEEDPEIRRLLDDALVASGAKRIDTTARTIFPETLWARYRAEGRNAFFDRYQKRLFPRFQRSEPQLNRNGTYFLRMLEYGPTGINQLKTILDNREAGQTRRSAMQVVIYDPAKDLDKEPYMTFPCLDYVAFAVNGSELSLTAFYAVQYIFDRAYGNYVGLVRLGQFVASELNCRLQQITCVSGVAELGQRLKSKTEARALLARLEDSSLKAPA